MTTEKLAVPAEKLAVPAEKLAVPAEKLAAQDDELAAPDEKTNCCARGRGHSTFFFLCQGSGS